MSQRTTAVRENHYALEGQELHTGDKAPDFKLQQRTESGLTDITLADFTGKTLLLSVLPSLDTPVCALQTKRFNESAAKLPDSVVVLTVSTDLPFAQARFCGAEGVDKLQCASDHRDVNFGKAYGVLIAEGPFQRCLSRAIFVVNPDGNLKYVEYVPNVPDHPNYDAALAAVA
ncbi:MAG TPA: thiol peroxidase [Chthonomonadaceae bacterium]|nr:thiol peroxidase [Chthonomonadaceae bacterium]